MHRLDSAPWHSHCSDPVAHVPSFQDIRAPFVKVTAAFLGIVHRISSCHLEHLQMAVGL